MKKYCAVLFAFIHVFFGYARDSDTTNEPSVEKKLHNRLTNYPNEKQVIHTDRDVYFIGEDVMFSVTSIDDITHMPVVRSGIKYIEIINKNGVPVHQQMYKAKNSSFSGILGLSDTLTSGIYYIRSYTYWQRNFPPEQYSTRLIQVINPSKKPQQVSVVDTVIQFQNFPEGQKIIPAFRNRILTIHTRSNGNLTGPVKSFILDMQGDTIAFFDSVAPGIAIGEFIPKADIDYLYCTNDGFQKKLEIADNSAGIGVEDFDTSYHVLVRSQITGSMELTVRSEGVICSQIPLGVKKGIEKVVNVPKENLPFGLLEFTLFYNSLPISTRLVLNKNTANGSMASINIKQQVFSERNQVKASFYFDKPDNISNIQITVRQKSFTFPNSARILNGPQLSNGTTDWDRIHQVLLSTPESSLKLMNQYLIASEFTRYKWADILQNKTISINYQPEKDSKYITGFLAGARLGSDTIKPSSIQMFFVGTNAYMLQGDLYSDKSFKLELPITCFGKEEIVLRYLADSGRVVHQLDDFYSHAYAHPILNYYYLDTNYANEWDDAFVQWQIARNYNYTNLFRFNRNEPWSAPFYAEPTFVTYPEKYIELPSLWDILHEISDGGTLYRKDNQYYIRLVDMQNSQILGNNPLVLFNGYPVEKYSSLLNLPSQYVEYIEYAQNRTFIGPVTYDGVINIITKDRAGGRELPSNYTRMIVPFYAPQLNSFSFNDEISTTLPLLSSTLFYTNVHGMETPKYNFSFYTGDKKGTFEILVSCYTYDGKYFECSNEFKVE